MAQRDYGQDIRNRLPEKSALQLSGNPGRIMIDSSIGVEYASIEDDIFTNSQGRFLDNAEGEYLDLYGDWFGVLREDRTDEEYRTVLETIRTADCTVYGVKVAIAALLGITTAQVTITNTWTVADSSPEPRHSNYAFAGDDVDSDRPDSELYPPQYWNGHNRGVSTKSMTIQVPVGSDTDLVESFIPRITIPNVTVTVEEV